MAGNFNNWKAGDTAFQLLPAGEEGHYELVFPDKTLLPQQLEYKYLQGGWDGVELDEYGNTIQNRKIDIAGLNEISDEVPRWMQHGKFYNEAYLPRPHIISEQFEIPQLIKTRRISALLPHDYFDTDKRYPVLYLQDGQNLFDEYAPFGNWAVDKRLAAMAEQGEEGLIVIAIDHAEEDRIDEFTPSYQTRLGIGEGKKYVRFLADTLKPYIDKNFRTLPERKYTGIGGSSMGALISIYAGLIYPEVYSKLMIFSPSLWVTPNMHFHFMNFYDPQDMRVYLYGGEGESSTMVPSLRRFKAAFEQKANAKVQFQLSIDPEGKHNESRWGQEFPKAVKWLFFDDPEN
jgi:predicted alpha/beta superfamily hydrolase